LALAFRLLYVEVKKLVVDKEELELHRADEEDNLDYT
jgi:hypothetical protein